MTVRLLKRLIKRFYIFFFQIEVSFCISLSSLLNVDQEACFMMMFNQQFEEVILLTIFLLNGFLVIVPAPSSPGCWENARHHSAL